MKSISILITYYNEIEYLRKCLDSLASQQLLPDEVLIYDDFSEINATELAELYSNKLNIKYYRSDINYGPSYGRNLLLSKSTSDYIRFHDADDEYFPNSIEVIINTISNNNFDLILNNIQSYNNESGQINSNVMDFSSKLINNDLIRYAINYTLLSQAITYRRSFVSSIDCFLSREVLPQSEDYEFNIRVALKANSFLVINEPLLRQNLRNTSYSHDNSNRKNVWLSAVKSLELNYSDIDSKYHDVIANKMYNCAVQLFRIGEFDDSKVVFRKSKAIAPLYYEGRSFFYKVIAKSIGEFNAEVISKWIN